MAVRELDARSAREDTDWATRARCRGMDPAPFFAPNLAEARTAIRVCNACDVRPQCLDHALTNRIELGVWGGLTERQRRGRLRQR